MKNHISGLWLKVGFSIALPWLSAYSQDPHVDISGVIHLSIPTNDIVYDESRDLVWASSPSLSDENGPSVVAIDPATGRVVRSIPLENVPTKLALSGDGSRLFALSLASPEINVLDPDALLRVQVFTVGGTEPWIPRFLAAVPNTSDSVVVVSRPWSFGYSSEVAVFDSGVARPLKISNVDPGGFADTRFLISEIFPGAEADLLYGSDTSINHGDGRHRVSRLRIDAEGIHLDAELTPLAFHPYGQGLVYDSGRLFTSAGEIWLPDASQLLGTFGLDGLPVAFADPMTIGYVDSDSFRDLSGHHGRVIVTAFDKETQRPFVTLPIPLREGSTRNTKPTAAVRAGNGTIVISVTGHVLLVPLASLSPWPDHTPGLESIAPGVERVMLPVNAIAAMPGTQKLLLATPNTAGHIGNSLVTFNPATGRVDSETFVGSQPSLIEVSDDRAYVYLSGVRRIAGVDLSINTRDLMFAADPGGGSQAYAIQDFALGSDSRLAVAYSGGVIAVFQDGRLLPKVDWNTKGAFAGGPTIQVLEFDDTGSILYASNPHYSPYFEFERFAVSSDGVEWLSSVGRLIGTADMRYAGGLMYSTAGSVVDPERSRLVGQFDLSRRGPVLPDAPARRVYFGVENKILVFDMDTYAQIGSLSLPLRVTTHSKIINLVKFSDTGLAFHTPDNELFIVDVTQIPLRPVPIPSIQPVLPFTPGVSVVEIDVEDMVYDTTRDVIYASTPNGEGALGDQIIAIDPESGEFSQVLKAELGVRLLALSSDNSQIFYTAGNVPNITASGYSFASEFVRRLDLPSGAVVSGFDLAASEFLEIDRSYEIVRHESHRILDMETVPGRRESVAVLSAKTEFVDRGDGCCWRRDRGPVKLAVFDDENERPGIVTAPSLGCTAIEFGTDQAQLYCSVPPEPLNPETHATLSAFYQDDSGLSRTTPASVEIGAAPFDMVTGTNGIYTTAGVVLDRDGTAITAKLPVRGPVAVSSSTVNWLLESPDELSVRLLTFDIHTLQQIRAQSINVVSTDVDRLILCGTSCLAFTSGRELYLVNTNEVDSIPGLFPIAVVPDGGFAQNTVGGSDSEFVLGYASLQPVGGGPIPEGLGIVSLRRNGVVVAETSVSTSLARSSGRIHAEANGLTHAGLAMVNPNEQPVTVSFYFSDGNGDFGHGTTIIPAHAQIAGFLNEPPFNGPSTVDSSFTFNSSREIAVVAMQGLINERNDFLFTTLPVARLGNWNRGGLVVFPHFVVGAGWTTDVLLINRGNTPLSGMIEFWDPSGQPAPVTINGVSDTRFEYTIAARASKRLKASGGASMSSGSAQLTPTDAEPVPAGFTVFSLKTNGTTVAMAGVAGNVGGTSFRMYGEIQGSPGSIGSVATAFAIANRAADPVTVTVEGNRFDGSSTGPAGTLVVPGNGQVALSLTDVPGFESLETPFEGLLRLSSSGTVYVIGLRARRNELGEYLIAPTPPLGNETNYWPVHFPYIVDSGGYSTKFIFLGSFPGYSNLGELRVFSQSGESLGLLPAPGSAVRPSTSSTPTPTPD